MASQTTLFLIVGLPGAGKTTRARELENVHRALRFTPDEWMIPLFGGSEAAGKRDLLEGLLIYAGLCALAVGTNVVLDFGLWGRDERSALRSLGASVGAVEESFICRLTRRLSTSVSRSAFSSAQGTPSRSRTLTSLSGVPSSRNRPLAS
jgi:predicted kinase